MKLTSKVLRHPWQSKVNGSGWGGGSKNEQILKSDVLEKMWQYSQALKVFSRKMA